MYGYGGTTLEKQIRFKNMFLENVDDAALGYAANESIKINATFRFDYWLLEDSGT